MAKKQLCQGFGRDTKWATGQEKKPGVYLYANRCPTDGSGFPYILQQELIGIAAFCDHIVTSRCIKPRYLVEIIGLVELRNLALRSDFGL